MRPLRHNLGNGVASRQRTETPGVTQPLGPPSRTFKLRAQAQSSAPSVRPTPLHQPVPVDSEQIISSGSVGIGMGSVIRIPIPGTGGLAIELNPRNFKGKTTSSLFIQSADGKRVLRLDYGPNPKIGGQTDYHWNQKGTYEHFGVQDHTSVGAAEEALFKSAKYFKYAGRAFLVLGAATDIYSIVVAKKRIRRVAQVATGWAGAWAGCEVGGAVGAEGGFAIGTAVPGIGNAIGATAGGFAGCMFGGVGGYYYGSEAGGQIYDQVEETYFEPVPETGR